VPSFVPFSFCKRTFRKSKKKAQDANETPPIAPAKKFLAKTGISLSIKSPSPYLSPENRTPVTGDRVAMGLITPR